jgi:putative ABC transport system permease protein
MLRITLKTLRANLARLLLSSIAVVLGVAFIAGTLIFSDGLSAASYDRLGRLDRTTSVDLRAADDGTLPPGLVPEVQGAPGVRAAAGIMTIDGAGLAGPDGRPVPGYHLAAAIPAEAALRSYDVRRGHLPDRAGEVVLDHATADAHHYRLGDRVRVGSPVHAAITYTLVGTVDVAGTDLDRGGAFIGLTLADVEALGGGPAIQRIVVAAQPGVSDKALAARLRRDGVTVRTHQQLIDDALDQALGSGTQFRLGLLMFAFVAVFVAAFVIANTFTIVLAQRNREMALQRLVGATRGQLFRSVVVEAALVGLLASVIGLLAGAGVARALTALYTALGSDLPSSLVVAPGTVVVSLLAGTGATLAAAALPAWRGTRVAPVAALSESALQVTRGVGRGRLIAGGMLLALGCALLVFAGTAKSVAVVAFGGMVGFLGLVMFSPALVPALIRGLGWPVKRWSKATVPLAIANAVRNPRRAASTAMALVIGIGLVSAFVVGAQSVKDGVNQAVDARIGADFLLVSDSGQPVPPGLVDRLRHEPAVGLVHLDHSEQDGGLDVRSGDPALLARTQLRATGNVADLKPGSAVVRNLPGVGVGGTVTVAGKPFRVVAVLPKVRIEGRPSVELTERDFEALYPQSNSAVAELEPAAGVSLAAARAAIERVVVDYPTVTYMDRAAYKAAQSKTIDGVLGFVTALLGLAVLISLIGVANTLTLSVVERTRENALLRAVGLTRGQLRGLLATEAVFMAVVGALCGIGVGIAVSASAVVVLNRLGGSGVQFGVVLPWGRLGLMLAVAAAAALLASVLPARRALRQPIVGSLAAE